MTTTQTNSESIHYYHDIRTGTYWKSQDERTFQCAVCSSLPNVDPLCTNCTRSEKHYDFMPPLQLRDKLFEGMLIKQFRKNKTNGTLIPHKVALLGETARFSKDIYKKFDEHGKYPCLSGLYGCISVHGGTLDKDTYYRVKIKLYSNFEIVEYF